MRKLLALAVLSGATLTGCGEHLVAQQVIERDPVLLYNALSNAVSEIQSKVDANKAEIARAKVPVQFSSDKVDGKMIHVRIAAAGHVREMTVWIEPGPNAAQTLLKADVPSDAPTNNGTDLFSRVKSTITADGDLVDEVLRSTEQS
ncbi:MAG: hypothetical protein E7773_08210 [Sphingomonas sp.]|uniref:hypothetical protein n=1 Tax=Sphingomonas sp. TaxID=28214 RepID=UPI00122A7503|nr:hypothetical protein [Sphingomonas sp.]THD35923.1 MAG: hypothetical protein E7773_08210 [Sphingomonas sp.]